jgi:hypothetical protein
MAYDWRYFSSYRLNKDDLEKHLKKIFGDWNFYISVGLTLGFLPETVAKGLAGNQRQSLQVLD